MRLLSKPSKMPGLSFSLPAGTACPASKIANRMHGEASVCHGCYAKGGNYRWPSVAKGQADRLAFVRQGLRDGTFVETMIAQIKKEIKTPYFRIHDSGDLFSVAYTRAWIAICTALPEVHFWAPTREWIRPEMLPVLRELAALPNVTVRPSALRIGDPVPVVPGLSAGTSVVVAPDSTTCPSTSTDDKHCDDHGCRKCWNDTVPVTYLVHGALSARLRRAALPVISL